MTSERATIRPITLSRLAETTHLCESSGKTTEEIAEALNVSHQRSRETILEAKRIGTLRENISENDIPSYYTTPLGSHFVKRIREEDWTETSQILYSNSPHYHYFIRTLDDIGPTSLEQLLTHLKSNVDNEYTFNTASVEVLGDWAERLGVSQRNAFTGDYYLVHRTEPPPQFATALLSEFDRLEERTGVDLRQRYLSIPELREWTCQSLGMTREAFDEGLVELVDINIGKLEISGAPIDTGAKEANLGIKQLSASDTSGLVTTSQSTDPVMAGVRRFGKEYYYLAVYDRDIKFNQNHD